MMRGLVIALALSVPLWAFIGFAFYAIARVAGFVS